MRWLASALLVAACREPPPRPPPPRACPAVAACDPAITDDAAFGIVRQRCWGCHGTNGIANHDFPDIAALRAAPVVDMVGSCQMPPDGLDDADRRRLVSWAQCH